MHLEINNEAATFPEAFGVDLIRAELIQVRVLKTILSGRIQNSKTDQVLLSDVNAIQEILRIAENEKEIAIVIQGYVLSLEMLEETERIVNLAFSMTGSALVPGASGAVKVEKMFDAMVVTLESFEAVELQILAKQAQDDYGIV